jgi:hypothetical protein
MKKEHLGSNFEDFLAEDSILEECRANAIKFLLAQELEKAKEKINMDTEKQAIYAIRLGKDNYERKECIKNSPIAVMIHAGSKEFYDKNDKAGFVKWCEENREIIDGIPKSKGAASRQFNVAKTIENSENDIFINYREDELWWTISTNSSIQWKPSNFEGKKLKVCHKSCEPWSNKNKDGELLKLSSLPKELQKTIQGHGTLIKLNDNFNAYIIDLINGTKE